MKSLVVGLLLVIAAMGWYAYTQVTANEGLAGQLSALKAQEAAPKVASLAQQAACDSQAAKVFHQLGYKDSQGGVNYDEFQSHFNPKLGKCFIAIESQVATSKDLKSQRTVTRLLMDAFEMREYGEYTWFSTDAPQSETPPFSCIMKLSATDERQCHSDVEYKSFMATYVE